MMFLLSNALGLKVEFRRGQTRRRERLRRLRTYLRGELDFALRITGRCSRS